MKLRDYQIAACQSVHDLHEAGTRSVCLVAPTGSGKTVMATALVRSRVRRNERCLFVAHRRELIRQSAEKLQAKLGPHTVGAIAAGCLTEPDRQVQVASIQTMLSRGFPDRVDYVVLDECVTEETVVGGKLARDVHVGDMVDSHRGKDRVTHVFIRQHYGSMVRLRIGETMLECTDNHPIWVERRGYVQAKEVVSGDMCCVRKIIQRNDNWTTTGNLQPGLPVFDLLSKDGGNEPKVRIGTNEETQPDVQERNQREDERNTAIDGALSSGEARERNQSNRSGNGDCFCDEDANERHCSHWIRSWGKRISDALQGRRWLRTTKDSDRGGRNVALLSGAQEAGPEEIAFLGIERVDSVEVYQPSGANGVTVYNFEVEGSHTFFANGILTHNCHHYAADDWSAIDAHYPNARIVGLTATPQRSDGRPLGDMFQELVVAAQYSTLIEQGHIVPCRVFQPENGVKSNETAKDPLAAYRELCSGALAFGFAPRVQHCCELADRFRTEDVPSAVIEAGTPKAERDETIRRFSKGELKVLWSVNALTEGVDVPQADCAILAKRFLHCQQYIQACGRVLRPYPGKTVATIIDLTGATLLHGFPTEDREYSLDGDGMRRTSAVALRTCLQCGLTAEAWRTKCPGCGFEPPKVEAPTLKIWDHKLREVFAGMGTPTDAKRRELERLVAEGIKRGWAPYFIQKEYSKLFGELPVLDCAPVEMRQRELERLRELRAIKGHKPGWVAVNYKRMFGVWPP